MNPYFAELPTSIFAHMSGLAAKHQAVSLRLPEGVDPSVLAPTPLQPRPELGPGL